ncbi:pilus assembly protein TadG-related protein [Croceibacterium xixiisoli]|uniref:TadE/TadG family type IV pilus assembly protein n=1 Tax=Croceibacterium xixiisoli TaxID=1476466 RepID=UPI00136BC77B|nr:TadE/TadG family type IV pilus assembly protein [Croceibacterium xixiisoli]
MVQDRSGATLPMMAVGLIPALAAIGSAVDVGRIYMVRAQMQAGVDAGAMAGARSFGLTDQRVEQVDNYFYANVPTGYLGSAEMDPASDFQTVQGVNRVKVDAVTDLPMAFMKIFGFGTVQIAVTATAEMQPKPLEVMVVLDNTGSMEEKVPEGTTRIYALQQAMLDFNNILHQGQDSRADLAMGYVTYTVTTNVGAVLNKYKIPVAQRDGFTNVAAYGGDPALGWMGCVENDPTVRDLGTDPTTITPGAFDVDKVLPGEDGRPGVRPYHFPPSAQTKTGMGGWFITPQLPANYQPIHTRSEKGNGRRNNLYRLQPLNATGTLGQTLANTAAYRQHFYDYYIGLNYQNSSQTDDVIVRESDGGYYKPGDAAAWKVDYSRIPYMTSTTYWDTPNGNYGYPAQGRNLGMPTPNWQCPSEAMDIQYGRLKKDYDDYINVDNHALMPASGTLHHIGMLWGYRLLTRDDIFTRTNPVPSEEPIKALVFMTDGETQAAGESAWYGAYGALRDRRISTSDTAGAFKNQVMRRFARVCENAKRDNIRVYIVSLMKGSDDANPVFRACAGSNYLQTSNQTQIQNAFRQIAVDLVDLHLTQ